MRGPRCALLPVSGECSCHEFNSRRYVSTGYARCRMSLLDQDDSGIDAVKGVAARRRVDTPRHAYLERLDVCKRGRGRGGRSGGRYARHPSATGCRWVPTRTTTQGCAGVSSVCLRRIAGQSRAKESMDFHGHCSARGRAENASLSKGRSCPRGRRANRRPLRLRQTPSRQDQETTVTVAGRAYVTVATRRSACHDRAAPGGCSTVAQYGRGEPLGRSSTMKVAHHHPLMAAAVMREI